MAETERRELGAADAFEIELAEKPPGCTALALLRREEPAAALAREALPGQRADAVQVA